MEKLKVREDNKKLYKITYIIITLFACIIAYINIMNTMNLIVLYSLGIATIVFLLALIVLLIIKRKRNTMEISYDEHQLLFYQSTYEKNKQLKTLISFFDLLCLLSLLGVSYYFYFKMEFVKVYDFYGLIELGAIGIFLLFILINDIVKSKN